MSFYDEMKTANRAMCTREEEGLVLARAIFAYVLWFYFDHSLKDEDVRGSWYGELYLETNNPDEHRMEQVHEETFVIVLVRRDNGAEDRVADCIFMPAKFLNPTAMARAFGHAELIERKVFVPTFVFEDSKGAVGLYPEFFSIANDFFTDEEDPELRHFQEILEDILTPETRGEVMQAVLKHYVNFRWGETK
ncbi:MAG: hypothetical protein WAV09_03910 [Minisyncoccia bacterium]